MRRLALSITVLAFVILGLDAIVPANVPVHRTQASQTVKECPADTGQGAYHLQGYDKTTGEPVCRLFYFDECPYAQAYSADDPICQKLEPKPAPKPAAQIRGK